MPLFRNLANYIVDRWFVILMLWLIGFVGLLLSEPAWESIVEHGEFSFLPQDSESRVAQRVLQQAFPDSEYGSSFLFVIERKTGGIRPADLTFMDQYLLPLAERVGSQIATDANESESQVHRNTSANVDVGLDPPSGKPDSGTSPSLPTDQQESLVAGVISPTLPVIGKRLRSQDGESALALIQLSTEFLHEKTWRYVNQIESELGEIEEAGQVPHGLDVVLSGSAVLGRDITKYRTESANWVRSYTVWIVVALLLIAYRAPLIALVPLVTLAIAVRSAQSLLAYFAYWEWIDLFDGVEVYLTVIAYGAGVDYSLFLISRYREELLQEKSAAASLKESVEHTGVAVAASACTEILGIFMLFFASFGKLSQSGVAISIALCVMLVASLSLTLAVLRSAGRWVFWPSLSRSQQRRSLGRRTDEVTDLLWWNIGRFIVHRPYKVMFGVLASLLPIAAFGLWTVQSLSYSLVAELPKDSTTTKGIKVLQDHFALGVVAPVTVILENPKVNFNTISAENAMEEWSKRLFERREELKIADIQCFPEPLGFGVEPPIFSFSPLFEEVTKELVSFQSAQYYVSQRGEYEDHANRAQLLLSIEPFSRSAMTQLGRLEEAISEALPTQWKASTNVHIAGATSSLRSMQRVAKADQRLIFMLVTIAVFGVLVILLRQVLIPVFLTATVILSFLVTLGVTWIVFALAYGSSFGGLDWSVPLLLFTLLMAVGADYNVLLVNRAKEEIAAHGLREGVASAVHATGSVITACGIVMAGTFATLLFGGRLASMQELGFALAFSVLLDTFVVRAYLVPAFLVIHGRTYSSLEPGNGTGDEDAQDATASPSSQQNINPAE